MFLYGRLGQKLYQLLMRAVVDRATLSASGLAEPLGAAIFLQVLGDGTWGYHGLQGAAADMFQHLGRIASHTASTVRPRSSHLQPRFHNQSRGTNPGP